MHKEIKQLIRDVRANGYDVEQGRTHIRVLGERGGAIASLPLTPGRGRWEKNLRSELRRKGILA
jgi:hypothetical protein